MLSCHSWSYQGLSVPVSLLQRRPEGTWLYHHTALKKTAQGKRRTGLCHQIELHQYHDENPELHKQGKIAATCLGHSGVYVQPVMSWHVPTWPRNQDHVCVCGYSLIGAGVNSGEAQAPLRPSELCMGYSGTQGWIPPMCERCLLQCSTKDEAG